MTKTCPKCGKEKELDSFHRSSRRADGRQLWCKACAAQRRVEWGKENPEKQAAYKRITAYGLRPEAFEKMLQEQDHKCKLCGQEFVGTLSRHVDHNHETGQVRGILCRRCNYMVGWYEAVEDHDKILAYLQTI